MIAIPMAANTSWAVVLWQNTEFGLDSLCNKICEIFVAPLIFVEPKSATHQPSALKGKQIYVHWHRSL